MRAHPPTRAREGLRDARWLRRPAPRGARRRVHLEALRAYDWSQITTIAVFGTLSDALYCHAHAHGARVTFGYKHAPWETNFTRIWQNATLVAAYARSHAVQTLNTHTDGWSLDMEAPVRDPQDAAQLTVLVRAISDAVHGALPSAQV